MNDHDAWGVSATTLAAFSGYGDVARYLLDKGADPNNDTPGFTALHCAIMRRDEQTVAALLARGANPNAPVQGVDADAAIVRRLSLHAGARRMRRRTGWRRASPSRTSCGCSRSTAPMRK